METPIFLGPSSLMCKCPRWAFCYPANQAASSIDALYAGATAICDPNLNRAPPCPRRPPAMPSPRARRVIAVSAGNHAQAVAYHAARLAIPAPIGRPVTAPFVKVEATQAHGAEVVLQGETVAEAQIRAETLARERGLTFVHPYDDPLVIAGQGTIALEMLEDAPELDVLVIPIGGGGRITGQVHCPRARS